MRIFVMLTFILTSIVCFSQNNIISEKIDKQPMTSEKVPVKNMLVEQTNTSTEKYNSNETTERTTIQVEPMVKSVEMLTPAIECQPYNESKADNDGSIITESPKRYSYD